jgi:hypothetical protein
MKGINLPNTTIKVDHYPDHTCRTCKGNIFDAAVMIKYDPLNTLSKFLIPVYTCKNCGDLLDMKVIPKKHEG